MRIIYLMNVRFPTEKAHGFQIAKMCEAFIELGHELVLVVPARKNPIKEDAKAYYGLRKEIQIVKLPVIDLIGSWLPDRIAFPLMEATWIFSVKRWLKKQTNEKTLAVTRDQFLAPRIQHEGWKIAFEGHDMAQDFLARHAELGSKTDMVIMTNDWKKNEAERLWAGNLKTKIISAPNAIDVSTFASLPSASEAKQKLGWDASQKTAVYVGHFYAWKGVFVLADSSKFLSDEYEIVMIGGTKEDFASMQDYLDKNDLKRVRLINHVPHTEVPNYLAAGDCLVIPNSAKSFQSQYTTSPIKLWEYLAAKRPVVASDLPSLRELVTDREVRFVKPDEPQALAQAMMEACNGDLARVEAGFAAAAANDWKSRADKLVHAAATL